jgi:hypothetical protein
MPSAGLCVRFLLHCISNINYLLSGKFYHYFHKKNVFQVTEYRFWYSIIGCSSEYPVNRVLIAIPNRYNKQRVISKLNLYIK